jgi:dihydrofolate reductase
MRNIVYYVATSLDGFISGPDGDISGFVSKGSGVDQYLQDLQAYDTVIMGRNTYEFGYRFGLTPGQPAYSHMRHYIFSDHLSIEKLHPKVQIKPIQMDEIERIRKETGTDIYLCGGGEFAGWLLDNKKINTLKLKLNPMILSDGVRLFGKSKTKFQLELQESSPYDHGLQIMTYKILY